MGIAPLNFDFIQIRCFFPIVPLQCDESVGRDLLPGKYDSQNAWDFGIERKTGHGPK